MCLSQRSWFIFSDSRGSTGIFINILSQKYWDCMFVFSSILVCTAVCQWFSVFPQQHYRSPIYLDSLSSSIQSATTSTSLVSSAAPYETATHSSSSSHETGVITGGSSGLSDIISLDWILAHLYWPVTQTATLKSSWLSEKYFLRLTMDLKNRVSTKTRKDCYEDLSNNAVLKSKPKSS